MNRISIPLTAITTPFGFCQYVFMSFGLRNASPTFQRRMDNILFRMTSALAYVDDIIVFSENEQLKFLGHLVTPEGILPLPDRVETIQNYPKPSTGDFARTYGCSITITALLKTWLVI